MPMCCLNRVTTNPATAHTAIIIQFRLAGRKSRPSRIRTTRIPIDIPPRILKAVSPARRQDLKRPPRDPSTKKLKVMSVRMRSDTPTAFMALTIATQAAKPNVSHINSMSKDPAESDNSPQIAKNNPIASAVVILHNLIPPNVKYNPTTSPNDSQSTAGTSKPDPDPSEAGP